MAATQQVGRARHPPRDVPELPRRRPAQDRVLVDHAARDQLHHRLVRASRPERLARVAQEPRPHGVVTGTAREALEECGLLGRRRAAPLWLLRAR